jgi:signal transduction histidine kinase
MSLLTSLFHGSDSAAGTQSPAYLAYSALDSLDDAILVTDSRYVVLYANLRARQVAAADAGLVGANVSQAYGGGLAAHQSAWEAQLARDGAARISAVKLGDDRRHFSEDLRVSRLPHDAGYVFMLRDVTDLRQSNDKAETQAAHLAETNKQLTDSKRAMLNLLEDARDLEAQLKREKASVEQKVRDQTREIQAAGVRLEASINSINVGFIMTDAQRDVMTINHEAKVILGQAFPRVPRTWTIAKLQEALGANINLAEQIEKCFATGQPLHVPKLTHADRILRLYLAPINEHHAAKAEVLGVVLLVEDITKVVAGERSRDEFFSIASHELRTPLTAIRGNTQMIQTYFGDQINSDPQLADMVNDIHESSVRLITLVNDFLDSSRLEQGKIKFELAPLDVPGILNEVMKEYQAAALNPNLYLKLSPLPKTLPQIMVDHDRLKQVLINLVGNAMKFTDKGGVTLSVCTQDQSVCIDVTDTGKGIPDDSKFLLFRKFQQASNNILTRDSTRSSGLGLYISRLIMTGMNGQLELFASEVDKGSTFRLTAPVAKGSAPAPKEAAK